MGRFSAIAVGVFVAAVFMVAPSLHAQTADPGIQQRMENQEMRIDQGIASGALSPKEAGRLEAQQARIKQREERMKADGELTNKERARLHNAQDRANRNIYRKKRNNRIVNTM